ncbi:RNA polymerase sigma factor [Nonomuraea sp. NPDC059194]|uniref:RNA polymerase sigma factor n=1 Tax=Nonomuraea sp. NPDC059194 TaxID=3346764 RepID=UPI003675F4BA
MPQSAATTEVADAELIRRSWQEPAAFAAVFDRHAPQLHRYAVRRLGPDAAEDVVSDAFLAAFQNRHRYDLEHPDARPWLYGIASNVIGKRRRDEISRYRAYHPNNKIVMALPEAEQKTYRLAQDKCFIEAVKTVLGKNISSWEDYGRQHAAAYDKLADTELNGSANLVKLGRSFAACLKVTSAKPTELAERGRQVFVDERTEVARRQGVSAPANAKIIIPPMKPEQAKPYLKKEVKAALDDLACGKDFYAAYAPQAWKLQQKVNADYGVPFAW